MTWPAYPKYTDSGVSWLSTIPVGWNAVPLWTLFKRTKRQGYPDFELLSVYRDYGVLPKSSRDDNFNKPSDDLSTYQRVDPGSLVVNKMKAWQGSVSVSEYTGIVSPAYFVYSPLAEHNSRFLHYSLRSTLMTSQYAAISSGVRPNQWDLDPQQFSRLPVFLPPTHQQDAIADFLDRETGKIDALIAKQEQLIATLREDRSATITHAVTKGLDPNVEMKGSVLDWADLVPANWQLAPLKSVISFQEGPGIMAADFRDEGVPLLRVASVNKARATLDGCNFLDPEKVRTTWARFRVETGDLLISASASMGTVAEVGPEVEGAVPYTGIIRVFVGPRVRREFMKWYLVSGAFTTQIDLMKQGSTIQHYGPTHLSRMRLYMPELDQQDEIAAFLSDRCGQIDGLIAKADQVIETLREYRSALITDAVTGKIDVRGAA